MSALAEAWSLDPSITYLNHGSFGACPRQVQEFQSALRAELEREPVEFLNRRLEGRLDTARAALATFVGADPDDLAFVSNATQGVNTILRSLEFSAGDELLVTDHAYNACRQALEYVSGRARAKVVVAQVPFPLSGPDEVLTAVLGAVTPKTRIALVDHVTSPTGLIFPIARLVSALAEKGVDALVDGAHAPGMVEVEIRALGAAYYTGNCHKWICAPKGAGFLWVRRDKQATIRPLTISHGANSPRTDRSRFRLEFDWVGTHDVTGYLCVPKALEVVGGLVPGGWPEVRRRNHSLVVEGRQALLAALGVSAPCPESMLGSLAAVPLADGEALPLNRGLLDRHRIEVPIMPWPRPPKRWVRVSAQLYNRPEQYTALGAALKS